jgi:hypothetical protein
MDRETKRPINTMKRLLAPVAVAATLCLGAAACGSTSKVVPNNAPTTTVQTNGTTPAGSNTTVAPTTTAPQSGGAGF